MSQSGIALAADRDRSDTPQRRSGPQPSMRKSCHFCRSRKIRCSGQSICSACQERNLDCVYGREGLKGRPKTQPSRPSGSGSTSQCKTIYEEHRPQLGSAKKSSLHKGTISKAIPEDPAQTQRDGNDGNAARPLRAEVEYLFRRIFGSNKSSSSQQYSQPGRRDIDRQSQRADTTHAAPRMSYEKPLSVLIEDFVEIVSLKFGDLGCHDAYRDSQVHLFRNSLEVDPTETMFDEVGESPNPIRHFTQHQVLQMIDVWFSHHPLTFILSKTLLLQSYRDGSHDSTLLAVILADVKLSQTDRPAQTQGMDMFRWAIAQLSKLPISKVSLSTIQALILIGWHDMCSGRARRSLCYLLNAKNLLSHLPEPAMGLNRINGMDVGDVESEVTQNIGWLTYAIILWISMQCDTLVLDLLPSSPSSSFPPMDETKSAVYRLDLSSDNTSTLPHQARRIRDLWPICHVAATTAHIYALLPKRDHLSAITAAPALKPTWESLTVWQLRQLSNALRVPAQDFSVVCMKVRQVLLSAIDLVETRTGSQGSQSLVLSAYHAMNLQLLFPNRSLISGQAVAISDELINCFHASARALFGVKHTFDDVPATGQMGMHWRSGSNAEVFMLGVDACSRVLAYFQHRAQIGGDAEFYSDCQEVESMASDLHLLTRHGDRLIRLASDLRVLSKDEELRNTRRQTSVKKRLKRVVESFDSFDTTTVTPTIIPTTVPTTLPTERWTPPLESGTSSTNLAPSISCDSTNLAPSMSYDAPPSLTNTRTPSIANSVTNDSLDMDFSTKADNWLQYYSQNPKWAGSPTVFSPNAYSNLDDTAGLEFLSSADLSTPDNALTGFFDGSIDSMMMDMKDPASSSLDMMTQPDTEMSFPRSDLGGFTFSPF